MIEQFLQQLGLDKKEQLIYLALAEIGVQPASVIAKKSRLDRVTTYKHLKKMAEDGFIKVYVKDGIQCFCIGNFETLNQHLRDRINHFEQLITKTPTVINVLKSLKKDENIIPQLQIFEGEAGIKGFFRDLIHEARLQGLKQIRMLTSNTFDERLGEVPLAAFIKEFYEDVKKYKLDIEIFEASGTLIPERIRLVKPQDFTPEKLPAARGTTNILAVGSAVYLACYKDTQVGLKIKQTEIAQMFHFLFDLIGKKSD